jgi:hypothetical protein
MDLHMPPSVALAEDSIERVAENLFVVCTSFPNSYAFDLHYPQQSKHGELLALKLSELLKAYKV